MAAEISVTPEAALDVPSWLPKGAYVESAIVIVQYSFPGEDLQDERGPFLHHVRDSHHGVWNQLGMIESVAGDLRAQLRERDRDEED